MDTDKKNWFSREPLNQVFRLVDTMRNIPVTEKNYFKNSLLNAVGVTVEPPEEFCQWSPHIFYSNIFTVIVVVLLFFIALGI